MAAAPHPPDDSLAAFGLGLLDDPAADDVARHLEACPGCRRRVADLPADDFLGRLRAAAAQADTSRPNESVPDDPAGSPPAGLPPELAAAAQYADIRELGRGGMGVVYLARNTIMDRLEVLKVVTRSADRFVREIQAAARLKHPNVVGAYSAQRYGGTLVFAMEYVPGEDLAQLVKARGPLPVPHACNYAYQAALGLQHAHENGMVHRDIKPSNLILTRDGNKPVVKILDFGLAKGTSETGLDTSRTAEGAMLGTPDYIAPEQTLDAAKADIRADIYSLGCTLYHLLAGRPPFVGRSLYEVLRAHHSTEAVRLSLVRPEVPDELAGVVARMMAKDLARRYPTPAAAAAALAPFFKPAARGPAPSQSLARPAMGKLEPDPKPRASPPPPPPPASPAPPPRIRGRRPVTVGAIAGLALLGLAIAWGTGAVRVRTPEGTLILERLPPDAEVLVDGATVTVTRNGDQATFALQRGKEYGVRARLGDRELELTAGKVTIGGEPVVVRVVDRPPEPQSIPPATGASAGAGGGPAPDRKPAFASGDWRRRGDVVEQQARGRPDMLLFGSPEFGDGDFTCEIRRGEGVESVGLVFRATDLDNYYYLEPGWAGNKVTSVYAKEPGQNWRPIAQVPSPKLPADWWIGLRLKLRGEEIEAYVNGDRVFAAKDAVRTKGYIGLRTWACSGQFRNPKFTDPTGKVLWDGLPELASADDPGAGADPAPDARAPAPDLFAAGTTWRGVRIVEHGQFQGGTGYYELSVDTRAGEKFTGHVFENGPNRNPCAVTGTVRGTAIEWTEVPQFAQKRIARMTATRTGTVLAVTFVCRDNGVFANDGRGRLVRVPRPGEPKPDDFVPVFDGRSLSGWEAHPAQEGGWDTLHNDKGDRYGKIVGHLDAPAAGPAPTKHLYTTRADYADVHVQARVKVTAGCLAGLWVRAGFGPSAGGEFPDGYQVLLSGGAAGWTTGDLRAAAAGRFRPKVSAARDGPPAKEWFDLDVIAVGPTVRVLVNGQETARLDDPTGPRRGRIALYLGEPGEVEVASVAVKEIRPTPTFRLPADAERPVLGEWTVTGTELVQPRAVSGARLVFGDKSWTDYDFSVEARMADGDCGFGMLFRTSGRGLHTHPQDGTERHTDHMIFVVAGLANHAHYLEHGIDAKANEWLAQKPLAADRKLKKGEWYTARVSVRGGRVRCFVNGEPVFDTETKAAPAGFVGLMTWTAPFRFRNIKVTDPAGKVLLEGLPDLTAGTPKAEAPKIDPKVRESFTNRGDWSIDGAEIVQANDRDGDCEIVFGDPAWTDYNFVCEAKVVAGFGGEISQTFRVTEAGRYEWVLGRWNGHNYSLGSMARDQDKVERVWWAPLDRADRDKKLDLDHWYTMEVRVRGSQVECLVDGVSIVKVDHERYKSGRVGLRTFKTQARYRNLKVTDPAGKVLFEGLPELPARAVDWIPDS